MRNPPGNRSRRAVNIAVPRVESVVARLTEMFDLATRISFTKAGDASMGLEISAGNIENSVLLTLSQQRGEPTWTPQSV